MDYRKQILSEISESLAGVEPSQLEAAAALIRRCGRIFCDGLGRSALSARGLAMRLVQLGFKSCMVGDATAPAFGAGDLLLICTASGTSPALLYHAQSAKELGGTVLLITANLHSPLAGLAQEVILIPAPDKDGPQASASVQPMGTLFEQTAQLVCDMLVLELMRQTGTAAADMRKRHANIE